MSITADNTHPISQAHPTSWSGVFSLAVCAFALIASEFLPVSLLTPLARDLHVSEGMAGQGIAISGAFAVLTSLFITNFVGKLNRKTLLLGLTATMGFSGAIVALAPNYFIYMTGRALIGIVVGGFWSMSAATAIRLVPAHSVPKALAIVNGGNALATVIAAPMGAYLDTIIGWRGAFLCLVPLSMIALIWQWKTLPSLPVTTGTACMNNPFKIFTLFKHRAVTAGMLASSLLFMGQFGLFTYIRPFLETITQISDTTISLILLIIGAAGVIGTILIGRILQRSFYQTLIITPLLMAALAVGLVIFGSHIIMVVLLLALWGLLGTSIPVGWWAWIARIFPKNTEAGGGLFVAVVQLSIALGATMGGWLFDHHGYHTTFIASAMLLAACALLSFITARQSATN